jgi:arylsulfatase A
LGLGETTIADVLAASGYATGLVGKWHLGSFDPQYHPNRRGFGEFIGFHHGLSDYYAWRLDRNGEAIQADGRYLTDVFTAEAVDFVRRHRREPFFLYLAYNAPHTPLQVPEEELAPFRALGRFSEAVCRIYAMVARMDRGIGQLLEELEQLGIADNTVVLFTSDNGPHFTGRGDADQRRFNAGLRGHKYLVYEGGIRVPAVVRWPAGLPRSRTEPGVVHFADWFPTLAAVAGAHTPDGLALDGRDALPLLRGRAHGSSGGGNRRFWQWNRYSPVPRCNAAMRDGPWKLVFPMLPGADALDPRDAELRRRLDRGEVTHAQIELPPEPDHSGLVAGPPQLYHVADDPHETADRAAREPVRTARMAAALDGWFAEVEAERHTGARRG